MSATLYREGTDLDELLATLDAEHDGQVRVVDIDYNRDGGVMGFFAHRRVGVHYVVETADSVPEAAAPEPSASRWARSQLDALDDATWPKKPRSRRPAAEEDSPLMELLRAAEASEMIESGRAPATAVPAANEQENIEFARMLLDMAGRKAAERASQPDPAPIPPSAFAADAAVKPRADTTSGPDLTPRATAAPAESTTPRAAVFPTANRPPVAAQPATPREIARPPEIRTFRVRSARSLPATTPITTTTATPPVKTANTTPAKTTDATPPVKTTKTTPIKTASTTPVKGASTPSKTTTATTPVKTTPIKTASTTSVKGASTPSETATATPAKAAKPAPAPTAVPRPAPRPAAASRPAPPAAQRTTLRPAAPVPGRTRRPPGAHRAWDDVRDRAAARKPAPSAAAPSKSRSRPSPVAKSADVPTTAVSQPGTPERTSYTLRRQLSELGVQIDRIPDHDNAYLMIEQLVRQAPSARDLDPGPGDLVVVAGPARHVLAEATRLCVRLRLDPSRLHTAGFGATPLVHNREARSLAHETRAAGSEICIVAVAVDATSAEADVSGREDLAWAAAMVAALSPDQLLVIVDATSKPADVRSTLAAFGPANALAVVGAARTASPASLWDLGIGVVSLDGRPATPGAWAALLIDRLADLDGQ